MSDKQTSDLDVSLVDYVCDQLFLHYNINKELLYNWQVELEDSSRNNPLLTAIVEEEIVLGSLIDDQLTLTYNDVTEFFNRFNALDDTVYGEFKIIILEVVSIILTLNYNNKIYVMSNDIHEIIVDSFLDYSKSSAPSDLSGDGNLILLVTVNLLVKLIELGCDTKTFQKIFKRSLVATSASEKVIILDFCSRVFKSNPCHFKFQLFRNKISNSIPIPFEERHINGTKLFSIQTWLKINRDLDVYTEDVPVTTLFKLTNSSNAHVSTLKVQVTNYNQFLIEINNEVNDSKFSFSFNQIVNTSESSNQGYIYFALTFDHYSNLNLYIDGNYSESIPCPELSKNAEIWNKLYIGDDKGAHDPTLIKNDELLIRNLTILNATLTPQWICLLYNLGLGYDWNFKEFANDNIYNLLHHLSFRGLSNVALKLKEISGSGKRKRSHSLRDSLGHLTSSPKKTELPSSKHLANGLVVKHLIDKEEIVNSLIPGKISDADILFNINDSEFIKELEAPITHSTFLSHDSHSIYSALYVIGGSQLILKIIESCVTDTSLSVSDQDLLLFKSIDLLLTVLNDDWRLSKEFENINGYGILSILLSNGSLKHNISLKFKVKKELRFLVDPTIESVLDLLLVNIGYDFMDPANSIIINPNGYRFLILNFDFFTDSESLMQLLKQFEVFISTSKYREFNIMELRKIKILKRILQFFKIPRLVHVSLQSEQMIEYFNVAITGIIKHDISVDNIKAISFYIVYSLYSSPNECNSKFGILVLKNLTEILCDSESNMKILKKFSRSITIHWILLLLNIGESKLDNIDHRETVLCGIRLLSRLLKTLGPNIIKRFFQVNRGIDILTHFLKNWWSDDDVLCQIYLSAFGLEYKDLEFNLESGISLNQIIIAGSEENGSKFKKLIIPDYLILMNNLVLNSVYILSERKGKVLSAPNSPTGKDVNTDISLNAIHLISSYAQSIERGFNNIKALSSYYTSKDWLNGIFELVGYLKLFISWEESELLINFKSCYERLTKVISNIFISKLFDGTDIFEIFNNSNDFTKMLALDIIFPKVFSHVNEFISVSNFIFNEKEFLVQAIQLAVFYNNEYVLKNFNVNEEDLNLYIRYILSILEIDHKANSVRPLRQLLGNLLILQVCKISVIDDPDVNQADVNSNTQDSELGKGVEKFNNFIKLLLESQITIFQDDLLTEEQTSDILVLLFGVFFKHINSAGLIKKDNFFNLIRTVQIMNPERFPAVVEYIYKGIGFSAAKGLLEEFFDSLLTKNNEEAFKVMSRFPTFKHIFNARYHAVLSKNTESSKMNIHNMISITLNNGGSLGNLDNIYIKSFERDCQQLKDQVINIELIKFNRSNQDLKENVDYVVSVYNSLQTEMSRMVNPNQRYNYTVDFIESYDRIRNKLIIEDQLLESEKLAYQIEVPVRKVDNSVNSKSYDQLTSAIARNGINTLSLSSVDVFNDTSETFEVVDDIGEGNDPNDLEEETSNDSYEDKNRKVLRSLYLGDHIVSLWNISQINGLAPIESLMILGSTHLYIIENYFHQEDGNVIDVKDAPDELRDPYLQLVNSQSTFLQGLDITNSTTGKSKSHISKSWSLDTLSSISKRQFLLRDVALEMFFTDGASILCTCISTKDRNTIYSKLFYHCAGKGLDLDLSQTLQLSSSIASTNQSLSSSTASFFSAKIASAFAPNSTDNFLAATKKWKRGEMSNFYYLMIINTLAGRTFNDLTQYPVFPWVIADYTSKNLDFSNPKTFRDLSKPMGAQTEPRASQFKERYEALKSLEDENSPAFHYGTHYSSAMIVSSYLIRLKPYVQSYLLLQGGKFDHADRLFNSIEKAWLSASKDNTTDVRELIPEFFYLPEFLVNDNNFEFGKLQNGNTPNNVDLPVWANGDPKIFIQKNREALESSYVSANLHKWIDLIFGYKQSGPEAEEALNIYHHLSYNGAINLDNINDEMERKAAIGMINNFGQTPKKIFTKPHTSRSVLNLPNNYLTTITAASEPKLLFESKLRSPIKRIEISSKSGRWVGRPNCVCSEDDLLIRKVGGIEEDSRSVIINTTSFLDIHSSPITSIVQIGFKMFLTGSKDGLLHIWKCKMKPTLSLQFQGTLRGHFCEIKEVKYSKNFKICVSSDIEGTIILWDLVRFKFIRKISSQILSVLIDISNDSGNIMMHDSLKSTLLFYTLNGDHISTKHLPKGIISSIKFSSINDSKVETGKLTISNRHSYWSEEFVSLAHESPNRSLEIYSLGINKTNQWDLTLKSKLNLDNKIGNITAQEFINKATIDLEDNLIRGSFVLIVGDSCGRVFQFT